MLQLTHNSWTKITNFDIFYILYFVIKGKFILIFFSFYYINFNTTLPFLAVSLKDHKDNSFSLSLIILFYILVYQRDNKSKY